MSVYINNNGVLEDITAHVGGAGGSGGGIVVPEGTSIVGKEIGEPFWWTGNTAPYGALAMDGGEYSRTQYAALFAKIGTKYGAGDGVNTFNVPNAMGKCFWGGTNVGEVKEAGLPNITGAIRTDSGWMFAPSMDRPANAFVRTDSSPNLRNATTTGTQTVSASLDLDASRSNSIYGKSNTVQPPAITFLPCIKAFDTVRGNVEMDYPELTEERIVGKLNGKFVYEYTHEFTSTTTQNAWVDHDSLAFLNPDKIIHLDGTLLDAGETLIPILWYATGSNDTALLATRIGITPTKKLSMWISGNSFAGRPVTITIRYTKTTD